MKGKHYTFTVSKEIIITHGNTNISKYIRKAIKYSLRLKCYNLIFLPEIELLFHSEQHSQISVRLSDDDIKNIKRISKRYKKSLSTTIDNMLKLYEVITAKRYSDDDVLKLNKRICLTQSQPDCPKITGDIIAKKTEKIKLRLPNGKGTQTIKSETLYNSIEYAPDSVHLSANEIRSLIQKFNEKYKSPDSKIIETRITEHQKAKLDGLKKQISSKTKDSPSDVLKYCIMYYKENCFSNKTGKPVVFTVPGNKTDKCFDTMFTNALSKCDEKTIVIEVCAGSCGVLPMYYNNNVKAYILNEIDENRRNLITKVKTNPHDLINACEQIYNLVSNSTYIYFNSKEYVIKSIKTFLKLNNCMPEAITLFEYCIASQREISISKYLNRFKERYVNVNVNKLRNYIYNSVVTGYNLFDLIEYYKDNPNVIFIIDPPYYLTDNCYSSNYPNMSFHKELAELLHKIKGKFILCLRINASRANNSKNNRLIDRVLYEFYNASYNNEKFYMYCDDFNNNKLMINFKNSGTLEAVISNYDFKGCEPISPVLNRYKYLYNI